ncbi:hypothetical protein G8O24_19180 [Bradyrhizobium sp. INPA01-394B]|uniref:hypothetical protein n=1 Tax=Bradyrhizobium campsiandrae TaxID=1729892 RepID=UPI00165F205E|nr:hypothetical protein [Bradyrhizobium campsiandrae]MBC9879466.1 hypothetical protein [Bradyrhizobium campsiandrae]
MHSSGAVKRRPVGATTIERAQDSHFTNFTCDVGQNSGMMSPCPFESGIDVVALFGGEADVKRHGLGLGMADGK